MCSVPRCWGDILLGWGIIKEQIGTLMELLHWLAVLHLLCGHAFQLLQWVSQHTFELHLPTTSIGAPDSPPLNRPIEYMVPPELLSD